MPAVTVDIKALNKTSSGVAAANRALGALRDRTINVGLKADPSQVLRGLPDTHTIDVAYKADPTTVLRDVPRTHDVDIGFVADPSQILRGAPTTHTVNVDFKSDHSGIALPSNITAPGPGAISMGGGAVGGGGFLPIGALGRGIGAVGGGIAAATGIGAAVGVPAYAAIRQFADMQEARTDVRSYGLTEAQTDELTRLAQRVGASDTSQFSALDAMGAIEMLLRNGEAFESVMTVLEPVALAASAGAVGGQDPKDLFAPMADVATDMKAIFGLTNEELPRILNLIPAATRSSKFDLQAFRYYLARGGPGAAGAGMTPDDFLTLFAASASPFSSGQVQGTALNTMFSRISALTPKALEEFETLGLLRPESIRRDEGGNITSARTVLHDALTGVILSNEEIAAILQDKLGHLAPDQLTGFVSRTMGPEAGTLVREFIRLGAEGFQAKETQLAAVDTVEIATIRAGTLNAQQTILGGKIETALALIGEEPGQAIQDFLGKLNQLADKALGALVEEKEGRTQQQQAIRAYDQLSFEDQESLIMAGFNPETGLYDAPGGLTREQIRLYKSDPGQRAQEFIDRAASQRDDPEGGIFSKADAAYNQSIADALLTWASIDVARQDERTAGIMATHRNAQALMGRNASYMDAMYLSVGQGQMIGLGSIPQHARGTPLPPGLPVPGLGPTMGDPSMRAMTAAERITLTVSGWFEPLFEEIEEAEPPPLNVPLMTNMETIFQDIMEAEPPPMIVNFIPRWHDGVRYGGAPQTRADRSDDRRHSNQRTVVRADVDEGGALGDPYATPLFE